MTKLVKSTKKQPVKQKKTSPPDYSKTHPEWDEYLNIYSLQMCPAQGEFKKRLAFELVKYVTENKDCLFIGDFLEMKGICEKDYYRFVRNDETLARAHDIAKSIIGRRRERGALNRKLSERTVHFTMSMYSQEWKELEIAKAKLGLNDDNTSKDVKYVIIEKFADKE